jgi:putative ABC transport system permease protein
MLGYVAGLGLTAVIGRHVFATAVSLPPVLLPITMVLALAVALAGSALPVRRATGLDPAVLLRG